MAVQFKCKKCGSILETSEEKVGIRIACPECKAVNKVLGIAMQEKATKEQIERMRSALNQHRKALWVFFVLMAINALLIFVPALRTAITPFPIIRWAVAIIGLGSVFLLLDRMSTSRKHLGIRKATDVFLCFALWPIWVILCVISYLRLKNRLTVLGKTDVRNDNDDA